MKSPEELHRELQHHVTAFVRSPESFVLTNERVTLLKGNAMDENQLCHAIAIEEKKHFQKIVGIAK